jgi:hypothetical protein
MSSASSGFALAAITLAATALRRRLVSTRRVVWRDDSAIAMDLEKLLALALYVLRLAE